MQSSSLPPLTSLAVYDGIPPKEEGMDPTVFWYWPVDVPKDVQLNQVGLYLTFTGFCRDFRSSKDCEYIQTDSFFTCFDNIGADVCLAASFKTDNPIFYRVLMRLLHVFKSISLMLCTSPVRAKNGDVENISNLIQYFEDFLVIFNYLPFFNGFSPNLNLWIKCEESIASMKAKFPTIIGASFTYKDYIIHNTINPDDILSLYISCKANLKILTGFATSERPKDHLVWLVGISEGYVQKPLIFSPRITLSDSSSGYPIILLYNEILIFVIFSSQLDKKTQNDMPELKDILITYMPNIEKECIQMATADLQKITNLKSSVHKANSSQKYLNEISNNNSSLNLRLSSNDRKNSQRYNGSIYLIPSFDLSASSSISFMPRSSRSLYSTSISNTSRMEPKQSQIQKQKSSKNKNSNQQQISLYRDNGFIRWTSRQASQSNFQPANEKIINFLNGNDNKMVRFCGLQESGTFMFMEKLGKSSTCLDGLNSKMKDASSDYLKFLSEL